MSQRNVMNSEISPPFESENVTVHRIENKLENAKIRSPLMSGIKGNLGKYIVRGTKAIVYIIKRQRYSKK